MRTDVRDILLSCLRMVLCGEAADFSNMPSLTKEMMSDVMELASKHDVAHLVALGAINSQMAVGEIRQKLQQKVYQAVYRDSRQTEERKRLYAVLEKAQVPFIPLKGSVLRDYYPEAWMRTSCDIDILVRPEDLERAVCSITEELNYSEDGKTQHDVGLLSASGVRVELHFELLEKGDVIPALAVLSRVWEYAAPKDGFTFQHELRDEVFYLYHIVHMAKHFAAGGCGIRTFADLRLLDQLQDCSMEDRNAMLEEAGLLQFTEIVRNLCNVWFGEGSHDSVTEKVEDFIISGGVYGNVENWVRVQQVKKGGKLRYMTEKVFMSREKLEKRYPICAAHKWLLPVMQVYRWIAVLFGGIDKKTRAGLRRNWSITAEQTSEMEVFLEEIGL